MRNAPTCPCLPIAIPHHRNHFHHLTPIIRRAAQLLLEGLAPTLSTGTYAKPRPRNGQCPHSNLPLLRASLLPPPLSGQHAVRPESSQTMRETHSQACVTALAGRCRRSGGCFRTHYAWIQPSVSHTDAFDGALQCVPGAGQRRYTVGHELASEPLEYTVGLQLHGSAHTEVERVAAEWRCSLPQRLLPEHLSTLSALASTAASVSIEQTIEAPPAMHIPPPDEESDPDVLTTIHSSISRTKLYAFEEGLPPFGAEEA